jgi:hypothetical protein
MKNVNKDNAQHLAGMAIGLVNRFTGKLYSKDERGTKWFSTVAANLVATKQYVEFLPYKY